jgi:serine O-acetyltransferase
LIGAGAKILGAIRLDDGVRVGANSVVVQDVPAGRTVVGIPGRIVRARNTARRNVYGIDLDHHLIPDPVGRAIGCLMERIDYLEKKLAHMPDGACGECAEGITCEAHVFDTAVTSYKRQDTSE